MAEEAAGRIGELGNSLPEFTTAHLEYLATIRETLGEVLEGAPWDRARDVRACLLLRLHNINLGLSYLITHFLGASASPDVGRAARIDQRQVPTALESVRPVVWWGSLSSWFSAFELGVLDLARGLGEHDPSARVPMLFRSKKGVVERRGFNAIAEELAKCVVDSQEKRERFDHFLRVAVLLRNLIHTHGVHPAWKSARRLTFHNCAIVCTPGRVVDFEAAIDPGPARNLNATRMLWVDLLGEAGVCWSALVDTERVRAVRAEITDSHVKERRPAWTVPP